MSNFHGSEITIFNCCALLLHECILRLVSQYGFPNHVTYDDMYKHVLNELNKSKKSCINNNQICFSDFFIEVERIINIHFYGIKHSASLKRKKDKYVFEASMALTKHQQILLEESLYLCKITVNKCIAFTNLDPILDRDDMELIGQIALIRAIQTYNNTGNFKAYAIICIRRALMNSIAEFSSQHANSNISLDDIIYDNENEGSLLPDIFISNGTEDKYISNEIIYILQNEAEKHPKSSCIYKGIIVLSKIAAGYSWTDIAIAYGVSTGLLSAWVNKAKPMLIKNNFLRQMLGKNNFIPEENQQFFTKQTSK